MIDHRQEIVDKHVVLTYVSLLTFGVGCVRRHIEYGREGNGSFVLPMLPLFAGNCFKPLSNKVRIGR